MRSFLPAAYLLAGALAQSESGSASRRPSASASGALPTGSPVVSHSTAVPSPSLPANSPVPTQADLPPKQQWCPSEIFCAGPLLQEVNLVKLYPDDKTFVDKPTSRSSQEVLAAFNNITANNATATVGQIEDFVNTNFRGEGLELQALTLDNFNPNPAFLKNVTNPLIRSWVQTVHTYWTQLIRGTDETQLCGRGASASCESSLIPLNHTFVVPGGRFREQYYWDSLWIVEGLIRSELNDIVKGTLQNFMDELDTIGFIPNGGRIYYLNRSQPPFFIRMLSRYVEVTNDVSILDRALPLAEKELKWWEDNRTVNVTSAFTGETHRLFRYAVTTSAPRPESYLTDYTTAHDPTLEKLNDTAILNLYAELATGAESGWDYTARWLAKPQGGNVGLRSLQVRSFIPPELNSILYDAHLRVAELFDRNSNVQTRDKYRSRAAEIKAGVLDLNWDASKLAFYDYNHVTNARSNVFSTATFYPYWLGIIPAEVTASKENAFKAFSSVNLVMNRYNGTFPATFIDTGLQWDAPNAWPMHQHIIVEALGALPANVSSGNIPAPADKQSSFSLIPAGQLGLEENQLPGQPVRISDGHGGEPNATRTGSTADINIINGTVVNGGNATEGEGWRDRLQREMANRYITSAFCSWRATGGSIPGILPKLSPQELNVTDSVNNSGNMFEKFSVVDIDSAGRGGEYTVQAGFGWTNGVVLILADTHGKVLNAPTCPDLLETTIAQGGANSAMASKANVFSAVLTGFFITLLAL